MASWGRGQQGYERHDASDVAGDEANDSASDGAGRGAALGGRHQLR